MGRVRVICRSLGNYLVMAACAALLTMQFTGLHMHVNADGYVGSPEGAHVHGFSSHTHETQNGAPIDLDDRHDLQAGHHEESGVDGMLRTPIGSTHSGGDHAGDRDISVLEWSPGAAKLLILCAWLGLALLLMLQVETRLHIPTVARRATAARNRWRPPLRAPPAALLG